MSEANEIAFQRATMCHLCKTQFPSTKNKHRHHDHTLKHLNYIGAYCARCNLQMVNHYRQLSCIVHNHSYDLGLVLKEMKQDVRIGIHVKQGLKFYSVKIDKLRFIDSCAFISASLSSLAKSHIKWSTSLLQ